MPTSQKFLPVPIHLKNSSQQISGDLFLIVFTIFLPSSFLNIFLDAPLILDAWGRELFSLTFYAFTVIF